MTHEEFLKNTEREHSLFRTLPAGRDLDRRIAAVLGDVCADGVWHSLDGSSWESADCGPRPYSTDDALWWRLLADHTRGEFTWANALFSRDRGIWVQFNWGESPHSGCASSPGDTLALAACRARLLAELRKAQG